MPDRCYAPLFAAWAFLIVLFAGSLFEAPANLAAIA
ncbi:hypothetical protein Ga0102493_111876 [Erythrobacter litoralis]|nr:hypothetical protein Ga0102493_111876 [Erythrobacter litoralis]